MNQAPIPATKAALIAGYQDRLKQHGPESRAVQYADRESHFARFAILAGVDSAMESVLDVGCGLGDFCHYLRNHGRNARYMGVDIVPEFVNYARAAFAGDPLAHFLHLDAEADILPGPQDYAVLSGVFNNLMTDNLSFMQTTLRKMFAVARKGIAFNAMSTWVQYRDPILWYVDPLEVFAFCKHELGGHPVLRHDYVTRPGGYPYEFAMYVYKEPHVPV